MQPSAPALCTPRMYEQLDCVYSYDAGSVAVATGTPPERRPDVYRGLEGELLVWVPLPAGFTWPQPGADEHDLPPDTVANGDAGDRQEESWDEDDTADTAGDGEVDSPPELAEQDDERWEEALPLNGVNVGDRVVPAVPVAVTDARAQREAPPGAWRLLSRAEGLGVRFLPSATLSSAAVVPRCHARSPGGSLCGASSWTAIPATTTPSPSCWLRTHRPSRSKPSRRWRATRLSRRRRATRCACAAWRASATYPSPLACRGHWCASCASPPISTAAPGWMDPPCRSRTWRSRHCMPWTC